MHRSRSCGQALGATGHRLAANPALALTLSLVFGLVAPRFTPVPRPDGYGFTAAMLRSFNFVLVAGAAVGVWRAQVRDREHDFAVWDRMWLIVDGPAPLALPAGALADAIADDLPIGRVA